MGVVSGSSHCVVGREIVRIALKGKNIERGIVAHKVCGDVFSVIFKLFINGGDGLKAALCRHRGERDNDQSESKHSRTRKAADSGAACEDVIVVCANLGVSGAVLAALCLFLCLGFCLCLFSLSLFGGSEVDLFLFRLPCRVCEIFADLLIDRDLFATLASLALGFRSKLALLGRCLELCLFQQSLGKRGSTGLTEDVAGFICLVGLRGDDKDAVVNVHNDDRAEAHNDERECPVRAGKVIYEEEYHNSARIDRGQDYACALDECGDEYRRRDKRKEHNCRSDELGGRSHCLRYGDLLEIHRVEAHKFHMSERAVIDGQRELVKILYGVGER